MSVTTLHLPTARLRHAGPLSALAAAALGGVFVLAIMGTAMLDPTDARWMLAGPMGWDPSQYVLGWRLFAQAPWQWPPGLNPDFGLELAGGIFHADAIPLIALPLKLLAPGTQQYWGLWLLACGMLQGFFGWVLMGRATAHPLARLLGAGLLVVQPMLLSRMGGHLALAGQFTLLAGLSLALRPGVAPPRQGWLWLALMLATSLIHSYLLVMVAAIWAADWLRRALAGWHPRLLAEAAAIPLGCAMALWAAGFFSILGGLGAPGYGNMMLDLAAPFDSGDWGSVLPDLPSEPHPESGNLYLGLGGLMLLGVGLGCALWRPTRIRRWPLLAAMLALLAFAASHNLTLLGHTTTLFELPDWAAAAASTLRASERFAWPALYLSLVLASMAAARVLGGPRTALLLGAALALQLADLRPGIASLRGVMAETYATPQTLFDPFWTSASTRYHRIRAIPAENLGEDWKPIATIAAQHGMATDAIYLARSDPRALASLQQDMAQRLQLGRYEPGTLYMLRDAPSLTRAREGMNPARDLLARIDGMMVLAPGWRGAGAGGTGDGSALPGPHPQRAERPFDPNNGSAPAEP